MRCKSTDFVRQFSSEEYAFVYILALGRHSHSNWLELIECTDHINMGKKKDDEYIAKQFILHIKS